MSRWRARLAALCVPYADADSADSANRFPDAKPLRSIGTTGAIGIEAKTPKPLAWPAGAPLEPVPDWSDPDSERERLNSLNRPVADGHLRAARQRPPSWSNAAALPSPGCFCSCCKGQRWWTDQSGWRCWTCHPPNHLSRGLVVEFRT